MLISIVIQYLRNVGTVSESYNEANVKGNHLFPELGSCFFRTATGRITPSIFIIGVQKGGTTSLAKYLFDHPQIIPAQRKDVYFFNNKLNFSKGLNWYKAHFAHKYYQRYYEFSRGVSNTTTMDATPNYFACEDAPSRIKDLFPQAKLILLLRNPVERAWSNYRMAKWHKFENLSFEDALSIEDERLNAEREKSIDPGYHSYVTQRLAYRRHGCYAEFLPSWQKLFKSNQLLILRSEDLFQSPSRIYNEVLDFCGLKPFNYTAFDNPNKGKLEDAIPEETAKALKTFYAPYNERLYTMINRDMHWD